MTPEGTSRTTRRRVFYIPGYDPNPPRRYRELYRSEGRKQAEISGYLLDVKGGDDPTSWRARGQMDGGTAQMRMDVLVWSDIVQSSMGRGLLGTYLQLVGVAGVYIGTGALRRLSWLAKGPVIAALYPIVVLLLQLALSVGLGLWLGGLLSSGFSGLVALGGGDPNLFVWALPAAILRWSVALPAIVALLRWFKSKDDRLYAHYLMHDYAFTASRLGAYPEELEARIDDWRARVAVALASDVDEVLIIGHSSGAQLAVSLVSDLLEQNQVPANGPALSLLTLGQVIPMVSFLPKADRLRRDLNRLAQADEITWVDITAPGDGCTFALSDPVAVSGVSPPGQRWPLILSAAFSQTLAPETLAALRHRYFRLHFQYLCAFDRPGDYDYFRITAGPLTLRDRFRRRRASQLRIDVAASRFSSMVA